MQGSVILTSGRSVPGNGEAVRRGEGVALVLRGIAIQAWRRGGKQWGGWSPRCVSVCLQLNKHTTSKLHIVSVYAPTWAASRDITECYVCLEILRHVLGQEEALVTSGDGVQGPHGLGVCNDAGRELSFFVPSRGYGV